MNEHELPKQQKLLANLGRTKPIALRRGAEGSLKDDENKKQRKPVDI